MRKLWLLFVAFGVLSPQLFAQTPTPTLPPVTTKAGWQWACPSGLGTIRSQLSTSTNLYIDQLCVDSTGGSDGGVPGTEYHWDPISLVYSVFHFGGSGNITGCGTALTTNIVTKATATSQICNSSITDNGTDPTDTPNGLSSETNGIYDIYTVDTGGVTTGLLACVNRATAKVQTCATGVTHGVLGIAEATVLAGGQVRLCWGGHCTGIEDGTIASGDYAVPSSTVAGQLHDSGIVVGAACPDGTQAFVVSPGNTGAGTNVTVDFLTGDSSCFFNGGGGGSGNVLPAVQYSTAYYPSPGTVATVGGISPNTSAVPEVFEQANGTIQQWMPLGVALDSSTSTSATLACTDFGRHKFYTAATAVGVSLPQANSCASPAQPNAIILISAQGAGTVTITPTTSTIGKVGGSQGATLTVTTGNSAFIYTDTTTTGCTVNGCYDAIVASSSGTASVTMSVPTELLVNGSGSATGSTFAITKNTEAQNEAWLTPANGGQSNVVQSNSNSCVGTSCTVAFTANVSRNDGLYLVAVWSGPPGTVTVSDTLGNSFVQPPGINNVWYICSSPSSGADTISIGWTTSQGSAFSAMEMTGVNTSSCLDQTGGPSAATTVTTASSVTSATELVVGSWTNIGSVGTGVATFQAGVGYSPVTQIIAGAGLGRVTSFIETQNQSASLSGTQTATVTDIGSSLSLTGVITTFKLSVTGQYIPFFRQITMLYLPVTTYNPTNNDCVNWSVTTNGVQFGDSGGICGTGTVTTSGTPSAGQIAAFSSGTALTTATQANLEAVYTNTQSPGSDTLSANGTFATTYTVGAASTAPGDVFIVTATGTENVNSGGNHTYQLNLGGTAVAVALGHSQTTGTNFNWGFICHVSVIKTGSTGRAGASCYASQDDQGTCGSATCVQSYNVPATVDFTAAKTFSITIAGMAASDTAQLLQLVVKKL